MDSRKRKQVASSDSEVNKRPRFDFSDNEDVIGEILSRIPTKSLLRFRWVCKSWKALISRSWFVEKHLSREKPVNRVQLLRYNYKGEELDFTTNRKLVPEKCSTDIFSLSLGGEPKTILGSCNGLLCLQLSRKTGLLLLLWNPCTGETKLLPELTSFSGGYCFSGLGYDFTTKDFKVIVGRDSTSATGSRTTEVAIFALKTGSWRLVEGLEHVSNTTNKCGRSLNGSLHWLAYTTQDEDPGGEYIESLKIVSFDLGEETLQAVVSLPDTLPQPQEMGANPCIGIGTTRTSLLVYHYDADSAFTIWTKEQGDGWSQLVEIPATEKLLHDEHSVDDISILENGDVLICFQGWGSKVVLYDPKNQTCRLVFQTESDWRAYRDEAIMCLETLVSPTVYGDVI